MLPVNLGCVIPSTSWNIQLGVRLARKNGTLCSEYIEIYTNGRFRPFSAYVCLDSEKTTHVINILESLSYDNIFRRMRCINMGEIKEVDLWGPPPRQTTYFNIYIVYIYNGGWWSQAQIIHPCGWCTRDPRCARAARLVNNIWPALCASRFASKT